MRVVRGRRVAYQRSEQFQKCYQQQQQHRSAMINSVVSCCVVGIMWVACCYGAVVLSCCCVHLFTFCVFCLCADERLLTLVVSFVVICDAERAISTGSRLCAVRTSFFVVFLLYPVSFVYCFTQFIPFFLLFVYVRSGRSRI